ncbi:MAG TPA: ROK family protein [Spirochaetia bacterium]|nr:ROK family protein [Spirochaetia bacterium]
MNGETTIGIDIGGSSIKAIVLREDGTHGELVCVPTPADGGSAGVIAAIERGARTALETAGAGRPAAIGIGTPGLVDDELTIRGAAVNLPDWEAFSLKAVVEQMFHVPVWGGNDVGLAVLGEYELGAGTGSKVLAGIWLGTGIGGGIIINGKPFRGHNGIGGEIGHVVVEPDGELCRCGSRGCSEVYASATGFLRLYLRELEKQDSDVRVPTTVSMSGFALALRAGRPEAIAAHRIGCEMLARTAGIVLNLFAPDRLLLGGGVVQAGIPLIGSVGERLAAYSLPACRNQCELRLSTLGADAGALGAAHLARRRLVEL